MVIAIANQKGGQAKTTTAQAIATGAAKKGRKILAIDLDAQGNLTYSMGGNSEDVGAYELLTGAAKPAQLIQHTRQGDLIASSNDIATADTSFTGESRLYALRDALKPIKGKYDLIVIDCPPTLNTLLINALAAADKVIIPITADIYSLQGLYQLIQTIREAKEKINNRLDISGVLFVKHSNRTKVSREITEVIKENCAELNIPVFNTTISESVAVREAQTYRQSIIEYAPRSKPAVEYMRLLEEIGI